MSSQVTNSRRLSTMRMGMPHMLLLSFFRVHVVRVSVPVPTVSHRLCRLPSVTTDLIHYGRITYAAPMVLSLLGTYRESESLVHNWSHCNLHHVARPGWYTVCVP